MTMTLRMTVMIIGTLRNEPDGRNDNGSWEKYYFSFRSSVLDYQQLLFFNLHEILEQV